MIDFWKSMTASHILAGARHVARRVTEVPSKRKDKGGNLYHVSSFTVNCITRWRQWVRPETQKQQTDAGAHANSRITTSATERVLKISEIYAKATEF